MNRATLDRLISSAGLVVAIVLLAASGVLFWAHNFIHNQVVTQLSAQQIYFPAYGSSAVTSLPASDRTVMQQYAGEQLETGAQAETWANHFIAVHLVEIGGGKTYAQLSSVALANPTNQALAKQVQTVFQGETLRGLLLNAYAFDTMALAAYYAGIGALVSGLILLVLSGVGFLHSGIAAKRR
ncbi:MAG: hypothetical protein ACHQUB_00325 [Candidatus Saccharimonadia bacterium]